MVLYASLVVVMAGYGSTLIVLPFHTQRIGFALIGTGIAALLTTSSYPVVLVMIAVLVAGAALVIPNLSALVSTGARANTGLALGQKSSASSRGLFLSPLGSTRSARPTGDLP